MQLCIFNPEHDLCLAKGRAHYLPPRSAVEFARRDAGIMQVLYPEAECCSVYDLTRGQAAQATEVVAWGWDAVVKHELLKRGVPEALLPSDETINAIRELQHRSTVLPLQSDCRESRFQIRYWSNGGLQGITLTVCLCTAGKHPVFRHAA